MPVNYKYGPYLPPPPLRPELVEDTAEAEPAPKMLPLTLLERQSIEIYWRFARSGKSMRKRMVRAELCRVLANEYKISADSHAIAGLVGSKAGQAYLRQLDSASREHTLARLRAEADDVTDDYHWSRRRAREADDYRQTHTASADHLDRSGASEKKPETTVQVATVILRTRNFTEDPLGDVADVTLELPNEVVRLEEPTPPTTGAAGGDDG